MPGARDPGGDGRCTGVGEDGEAVGQQFAGDRQAL
jgi:hypothetical protein